MEAKREREDFSNENALHYSAILDHLSQRLDVFYFLFFILFFFIFVYFCLFFFSCFLSIFLFSLSFLFLFSFFSLTPPFSLSLSQDVIKKWGAVFIKLNTRSPKDVSGDRVYHRYDLSLSLFSFFIFFSLLCLFHI